MSNLESKRLLLRPFELADAEFMFKNWASSDKVTKYLTWPSHKSVDETKEVIKNWLDAYEDGSTLNWAIVLKDLNEPIGSIGVVEERLEVYEATIGYCIGDKWWGQGIMAEALKMVIRYLFEEKSYNRIIATHDVNNPNSGKVMQKAGLLYEGTLKQAGRNNQGIIDEVVYGLIRDDWINKQNEN